jgi:hypothetical protein
MCKSEDTIAVFKKSGQPRYSLERHFSRESALNAKRENVDFYFCLGCQFLFNKIFNHSLMNYLVDFECSRKFSDYFNNYLLSVCQDINEVFSVEGKTVVEIGCGDGHFLMKLRDLFKFEGWGFEPSLIQSKKELSYKDLKFIGGYYGRDYLNKRPDLLILRHILEHLGNLVGFFEEVVMRQGVSPLAIYVEVPAMEWVVGNDQVVAFSNDHCNYFSKNSLELLFESFGYLRKRLSFSFKNEYLQYFGANSKLNKTIQCPNEDGNSRDNCAYRENLISQAVSFAKRIPDILERLRTYFFIAPQDTVLWGAGGKGTLLLNTLDITYEQFPFVVDSNPNRHNTYIPVTGQQVISPNHLKNIQPEYVLITNPSYYDEIALQLVQLGVKAKIKIVK